MAATAPRSVAVALRVGASALALRAGVTVGVARAVARARLARLAHFLGRQPPLGCSAPCPRVLAVDAVRRLSGELERRGRRLDAPPRRRLALGVGPDASALDLRSRRRGRRLELRSGARRALRCRVAIDLRAGRLAPLLRVLPPVLEARLRGLAALRALEARRRGRNPPLGLAAPAEARTARHF